MRRALGSTASLGRRGGGAGTLRIAYGLERMAGLLP